eukprot:944637-Pyramimonas_sp.AAC.1
MASGTGLDKVSPRQLLEMRDEGLECPRQLTHLNGGAMCWPTMWKEVVFRIQRTGGLRPIALTR